MQYNTGFPEEVRFMAITTQKGVFLRPAEERGKGKLDWLDSAFTFSFGDYFDSKHMHFQDLRVINDDVIAPGGGFGMHPHRDMEIITYVLSGALEHKDSLGNGSVIRPGDVQRMSAGTGILHSEFNASDSESAHLLQIWILPQVKNVPPSYDQQQLVNRELKSQWQLLISPDPHDNVISIYQDARLFVALLDQDNQVDYVFKPERAGWLQMAKGSANLFADNQNYPLKQGDGVGFTDVASLQLTGLEADTEILLFDLPVLK